MGWHSLKEQLRDFGVLLKFLGRLLDRKVEAETLHLMRYFWDQNTVTREARPALLQDQPMQRAQLRTVFEDFPGTSVGVKTAAIWSQGRAVTATQHLFCGPSCENRFSDSHKQTA